MTAYCLLLTAHYLLPTGRLRGGDAALRGQGGRPGEGACPKGAEQDALPERRAQDATRAEPVYIHIYEPVYTNRYIRTGIIYIYMCVVSVERTVYYHTTLLCWLVLR